MRRAYSLLFVVVAVVVVVLNAKKRKTTLDCTWIFIFFHMYIDVPVQVFLDAGRVVG
jgi:hypothetical protein